VVDNPGTPGLLVLRWAEVLLFFVRLCRPLEAIGSGAGGTQGV
jgi:hypothetical protein